MEVDNLFLDLGHTGICCLSEYERAALESSLLLLKSQIAGKLTFWGKIYTSGPQDYLLVQAFPQVLRLQERNIRTTYYSNDGGVSFKELPLIDEQIAKRCQQFKDLFSGTPSFEYSGKDPVVDAGYDPYKAWQEGIQQAPDPEVDPDAAPAEDAVESPEEQARRFTITEEQRLSSLVNHIDEETSILPKGAVTMDALFYPKWNRTFEGLSRGASQNLDNYVHFVGVPDIESKKTFDRDIFPSLGRDVPKGCWSLQFNPWNGVATIRNFLWPGFTFFHMSDVNSYGHVYIGHGQKNLDFGFMT
mmetsp:Transcript_32707/g.53043  ORF Transcript_32707/g.53043 Transcript_32707/m.53043 type:complete len:302 (-) Transcript_32707:681-1586(-)